MDKHISSNQFIEYSIKKSVNAKLSIIRQQKEPNPFLIPWYQRAKSCLRKSLRNGGDLLPIYEGIEILMNKIPQTKRQNDDKVASISALEKFSQLKLPRFLYDKKFEVIKLDRKTIRIKGLDISLSPEFVFKLTKSNGDSIVGAMKIHVCKTKPFSFQAAELASVVLYDFLREAVGSNEKVDPRYCYTIDIFGDRIVPAPLNIKEYNLKVDEICDEIVRFWDVA